MFIYHFLISNILISLAVLIILLIKWIMGKRLSVRCSYLMWLFVIVLMIIALVPNFGISPFNNYTVKSIKLVDYYSSSVNISGDERDLYISVSSYKFLYVIWLAGLFVNLSVIIYGRIKLNRIVINKKEDSLFDELCKKIGIKADLYISSDINNPMSFGIIKPVVLLPEIKLNNSSLEHIFLHELIHHKHKDILVNYLLCLLGAVYWFNPIAYIMFSKIRLDMEIYCDYSVIKYTGNHIEYGNTILNMAEHRVGIRTASYLSDSRRNLKSRIVKIAEYKNKPSAVAGRIVFVIVTIVTLIFSALINSYGYSINEVSYGVESDYIDLKEYFRDYEGCFVLYDTANEKYVIYNEDMAKKRVSPNSTYKIPIALNGLENGIITNENNEIEWDGKENPFDEWNSNHNLNSAMKYSVNWYFQTIDSWLGKNEISDYLKKINYGNMKVYNKENYWLENSLKISPIEQVEFLKRFYNNEFNFDINNINYVLNSIKLADNIYGKTGTGMVDGKTVNGWFVGIIDKGDNSYIFATRIDAKNNATGLEAEKITENILKDLLGGV